MDPILQVLLSWQFVLYGLAVAMIMYIIRQVAEYLAEVLHWNLSSSKLWNELFLPLAPIILGVVGVLILKKFPYPGFVPDASGVVSRGNRIVFGLVSGGCSTIMYRVLKSLFYQKMVGIAQNFGGTYGPTINVNTVNAPTEQIPPSQLPPRGQV